MQITWAPAAKRALRRLPEKTATAVIEFAYGALAENPHRAGKPLRFELTGIHTARRGDFRVLYQVDDENITILVVEHRADVYRRR